VEQDGTWSVHTEWHQWGERTQKPNLEAFLSELKRALKTHRELDFRSYWQAWRGEDPAFSVVLRNTISDAQRVF
jgi:predicted RNA-binding protein